VSRTSWTFFWLNIAFIPLNLWGIASADRWWSWAALTVQIGAVAYGLHVHRYIKRSRREREPDPPRNVRVVNRDGTTIPLELVYDGWVDGCHQWRAVTPWKVSPGWEIRADAIPAHTSIVMRTA
jgi:hypothetical protein